MNIAAADAFFGIFGYRREQCESFRADRISDDICRCHDHRCHLSGVCSRYLMREVGGDRTPHTMSMRDA